MWRIILLLAVLALVGCTDGDQAKRVLGAQGFTKINLTGYNFFACGKDDLYHTGFTAKSPIGVSIEGTVCSGMLFKNATIRFQ